MFCCQCSVAVDRITEERHFCDIWNDHAYCDHRKAARNLPQKNPLLTTCQCDRCTLRRRNPAIHNFTRPLSRIECGNEVKTFSVSDIARKFNGIRG